MVKFKCIYSGQIYQFDEHDAEGMRKHSEYVEVKDEEVKAPYKVEPRKAKEFKDE